jgi:hypothetical protein
VAERARFVTIEAGRIDEYAAGLPEALAEAPGSTGQSDPETAAAFATCMNAINFGSGWWPTVRKRPGLSGYGTMAAGLEGRFEGAGPWRAGELVGLDAAAVAAALGQDPGHPLMAQFATVLQDVGRHLLEEHAGRYLGVVEAADSVPALAAAFAGWSSFADASSYEGRTIPFYKRAQIAAADLYRAGVANLPGLEQLTAFADNLVPHVLRVDGVLQLDPVLVEKIEAGELLEHGASEEVELRACTVHAIELIARACDRLLSPAEIDSALWNRGRERRYKSVSRSRSRNTAY